MKVRITIEEEQLNWLFKRLKIDWDEEVNYQINNSDGDTEYLEELYKCYESLLGKPKNIGEAMAWKEILQNMKNDIEEVKKAKY